MSHGFTGIVMFAAGKMTVFDSWGKFISGELSDALKSLTIIKFLAKMTNTIDLLKQTTAGLMMPSESEYPFEVFSWESTPLNETTVLEKTGHSQDTIEVVEVDDFFRVATTEEDWHEDEEKATVKRFQNLVNVLKTNLTDLQVYKIGNKEIDVYIIGTTPDGKLTVVSTKVVET